ncbi:BsuBI/PstI family type II restriction endonuclease [Chloroflexus sp. Y-396-1]|uniref:BsuBI/PstI family type II restriction endonuclease n=1 Tax=Chloroflexus sp. Y-396-1 TaxID=867845 RepID=UPI00350EF32F
MVNEHGKMPDVIVHLETKNSLFLIEAVTSYGSIDIKRHNELKGLFRGVSLNPIFVTVFSFRKVMMKCLHNIA